MNQNNTNPRNDRNTITKPPQAIGPKACPAVVAHKIQERHHERLAVVYVRQSTPQQVEEHRESTARQYALADQAVALGWPRERVLVIDEDQGQSGRTAEGRFGFQRLLTEVTLDHVGLVLSLEMSRLARSCKDWHQLLDVCAVFGTLLGDQDGLYDPSEPNDRLLLGLRGTMSEVELHTMRNRLERGKLHKAERGALYVTVPFGYVKSPAGEVTLDPDEQVQAVIRLIFDQFTKLGSARAVFRYLLANHIKLGMRLHKGDERGQLIWQRPRYQTIVYTLHHPMYAGAYVYGRTHIDHKRIASGQSRTGKHQRPFAEARIILRDRLPAYIPWERYLANQQRLQDNRARSKSRGAPRRGQALLTGLVICGTCGRRLLTRYHRLGCPAYHCPRYGLEGTGPNCPGLTAPVIDELVGTQVLSALEPAALEVSLKAVDDILHEREHLEQLWQQRLERARYEASRAERQYQTVEPENRLVARTLELRWEQALREQRQLEEDHERFQRERPQQLTVEDRRRIQALATNIPDLWAASRTTPEDRKEIIRCLIERIVVHVERTSELVRVIIHWKGGHPSQHEFHRPVKTYAQLRANDQLEQRLRQGHEAGHGPTEIAEQLAEEGFVMPRSRQPLTREMVIHRLRDLGLNNGRTKVEAMAAHEWRINVLAKKLRMPMRKLGGWIIRGWLNVRWSVSKHYRIVWADDEELARLRQFKRQSKLGVNTHPPELTTPKQRPNE